MNTVFSSIDEEWAEERRQRGSVYIPRPPGCRHSPLPVRHPLRKPSAWVGVPVRFLFPHFSLKCLIIFNFAFPSSLLEQCFFCCLALVLFVCWMTWNGCPGSRASPRFSLSAGSNQLAWARRGHQQIPHFQLQGKNIGVYSHWNFTGGAAKQLSLYFSLGEYQACAKQ